MKKIIRTAIILAFTVCLFTSCGNKEGVVSGKIPQNSYNDVKKEENIPEEILNTIEKDYADTIDTINSGLDELKIKVGYTYDDYLKNNHLITEWYGMVLKESYNLYERTGVDTKKYFKAIVETIDVTDQKALDKALDEFYDRVYDDAMDEYYDSVYDNAMDEIYDEFYDGIVDDGYDMVPYDQWLEVSSECYSLWSDVKTEIYKSWSETRSLMYRIWSEVDTSFYINDFDVDKVISITLAEWENEKNKSEEPEESVEDVKTEETEDGMRSEFKEAMDTYELFFDEYVKFMKEYMNADANSIIGMMGDYIEYMELYAQVMDKLNSIDTSQLSAEEALYYAEVTSRITASLMEIY